MPQLTAGNVRFEFLPADAAEPRGDERLRRFHGTADADLFLQQFSVTLTREALLALLGEGRGFGTGRMGERELRAEVAARLARDELRVVEVGTSLSIPAFGRGAAYTVLRWPDRPRRGESVQHFHGADDALRFLERLHADPWSRRAVEDAARRATSAAATDPASEVLDRFAGQLATGRAQLVRLPDPDVARAVAMAPRHSGATQVPLAAAAEALLPRLQLCEIPDIMERKLNWPVSARLMRRWFESAPYPMDPAIKVGEVDPRTLPPSRVETQAVTMEWALRFQMVATMYEELLSGGWNTVRGRVELKEKIKLWRPSAPGSAFRFGDLSKPVPVIDATCQVNLRPVGGLLSPLDDFYGAIANGLLKLAVSGIVRYLSPERILITVDEVGVYLRDTYDFNDEERARHSQPLGSWNRNGVVPTLMARLDVATDARYGAAPPPRPSRLEALLETRYAVRNEHFFTYRNLHGRGGDFVIFSDVRRTRLRVPLTLTL